MKIGLPFSISVIFWGVVACLRYASERFQQKPPSLPNKVLRELKLKVAVCVPAHNEERCIERALESITRQIRPYQVYVVSDGSTDRTAELARTFDCHVLELSRSRGKARALRTLITKFNLLGKYEYVLIVDADTQLEPHYTQRALAHFEKEPDMAALAAYATPIWGKKFNFSRKFFIAAYRTKLYTLLQFFLMYPQTWKYTNINAVVPGFAAMYRSRILKKLQLVTPGIIIEDFNLAFQIHKKNLGWIAHFPYISAAYHDPVSFSDYYRQVKRWNVGFYQTMKKYGIWPSLFWISTGFFSLENLLLSISILLIPLVLAAWVLLTFYAQLVPGGWEEIVRSTVDFFLIGFTFIFAVDYLFTMIIAFIKKRPSLLFAGLGFWIFSFINSYAILSALPFGLMKASSGRWIPAKRG